jgi:magnesium-transporting ATPase (P-type)
VWFVLLHRRAGDNYETQVIFLVSGYQYVSSAIAFNFGYEFRRGWWRNYVFVAFALFYTFLQFYITMVPSKLSCVWRVNCVNEDTVRTITSADPLPIQNPFNTTVMPESFRWKVLLIMICNAMATSGYEYFIVNGVRRNYGSAAKKQKSAAAAAAYSGRGSSAHDRVTQQVHDELAHEPKFKLFHERTEAQV